MSKPDLELARLAKRRKQTYDGNPRQRDMFLDIGYFVSAFGIVDFSFACTLAVLTRSHDHDMFELLARGMDARVKLERIRAAAKTMKGIGANLNARLKIFETTILRIRNEISHGGVMYSEDAKPLRYFHVSVAKSKLHPEDKPIGDGPAMPFATSLELFGWAEWLWLFAGDIRSLEPALKRGDILEVAHPKSPLRKGDQENRRPPGMSSTPGKPAQKPRAPR
jgi:hypothetical protein